MLLIPKVYTPIGVEDGTVEGTEHSDFEKDSVFFKSQSQEKKNPGFEVRNLAGLLALMPLGVTPQVNPKKIYMTYSQHGIME